MYKTSRKGESDNGRRGRDSINSRRVDRRVKQERQVSMKQNELDMAELSLIQDLSSDMVHEGIGESFLVGKYLEMYFGNHDTREHVELSEQDINEIDSKIPDGPAKKRFKQYGINPTIRNILYFTLVMTIIAALIVPADARRNGNHGRSRRKREAKARRRSAERRRQQRLNEQKK